MLGLTRKALPACWRARLWNFWRNYIHWPMPLWRIRRRATIRIAGHRVRFVGIRGDGYRLWVRNARRDIDEPTVTARLAEILRPGDIFLDVGSYVGGYALLASAIVGKTGRVYAFEPDPRGRGMLIDNVKANDSHNVEVIAAAIAGHVGAVDFSDTGTTVSRIIDGNVGRTLCTTLDAFCEERDITPSVIKMDIEGGEAQALASSASRRSLAAVRALIVEIHAGVAPTLLEGVARESGMEIQMLDVRSEHNYNVALTRG